MALKFTVEGERHGVSYWDAATAESVPKDVDSNYLYVTVTGTLAVSGLIQLVILECFFEITPDFLCPFMND